MYQRARDEILEGIDHAYAIMDDILVAGRDISHHDSVLEKVLYRAKSYNLKLNFDKVRVRIQQVPYVGHIISAEGLEPDPKKVRTMRTPSLRTKEDVRRFQGSIQYLAKFLPMLAEVETPLREFTKRDVLFHWDAPQAGAFQRLKHLCCTAPVLAYYDVPAMTCMPSLLASNIWLTSMAESTVRCLLFSRQRWRTHSSNDLQAIAFRINFSVSVMSRPRAKSFRSRWQSCRKFPLATEVFGRTWPPPWLDSSWLLRVLLCTLYTLSSISLSLTFYAVSPVPVCVVFVVRNPTSSTPCYVFTTCTPCWITSPLAWFNVIG